MDDIVSWCKTGLHELNSLAKIAEDGNSLEDKQWTPLGTSPMVPEEEDRSFNLAAGYLFRAKFPFYLCRLQGVAMGINRAYQVH